MVEFIKIIDNYTVDNVRYNLHLARDYKKGANLSYPLLWLPRIEERNVLVSKSEYSLDVFLMDYLGTENKGDNYKNIEINKLEILEQKCNAFVKYLRTFATELKVKEMEFNPNSIVLDDNVATMRLVIDIVVNNYKLKEC